MRVVAAGALEVVTVDLLEAIYKRSTATVEAFAVDPPAVIYK